MNGRELHEAIYSGASFDRLPVGGVGPWQETLERWQAEGLEKGVDLNRALGLGGDDGEFFPLNLNMVPAFPIRILSQDSAQVTLVDEYGITKMMLRSDFDRSSGYMGAAGATSSMSHWLDFPDKTLADWKTLYEERFNPALAGRLPENWESRKPEWIARCATRWVSAFCFPLGGLFGGMRQLLGLEGLVYATADNPALIRTIANDLAEFWIAAYANALVGVRLDQITFFEDMCATKGPLMGPAMFEEFLAPAYRKAIGALKEMGVRQFWMDSDGNSLPLIPAMLKCGLTGTSPCEVNSGMEPEMLREAFPTLNLSGGIDKRALTGGVHQIDEEVRRRFETAWRKGRYVPHLDHGAPPDISWPNIRHFAQQVIACAERPLSRVGSVRRGRSGCFV
jgi:uroporphyrinogen decarboxylase